MLTSYHVASSPENHFSLSERMAVYVCTHIQWTPQYINIIGLQCIAKQI